MLRADPRAGAAREHHGLRAQASVRVRCVGGCAAMMYLGQTPPRSSRPSSQAHKVENERRGRERGGGGKECRTAMIALERRRRCVRVCARST